MTGAAGVVAVSPQDDLDALLAGPPLTPLARRKAAKRARYAAEAAVPAIGEAARRQAARARELQQLLGDHHDSVVARAVLLDLAAQARAAGQDTFSYGLMYQGQACQAAKTGQARPRFAVPRSSSPHGHAAS